MKKDCPICNVEFDANKFREQICCSKSCARTLQYQGKHAPNWKGGRIKTSTGYIDQWVGKDYPGASSQGYVKEHRYIMEQELGRSLEKSETVHHINGDRTDNRLENLQLRNGLHGKGASFMCIDCGSNNIKATKLLNAEA